MALRLDMLGITVRDMGAALRFYEALGLEIPAGMEKEAHVEARTEAGLRVAWDTVTLMQELNPGWTEPSGSPRVALAFLCSSPAEVDAKYSEMTGLGYHGHREPWDAFWGQRYAVIEDPDGNPVDLFAPL